MGSADDEFAASVSVQDRGVSGSPPRVWTEEASAASSGDFQVSASTPAKQRAHARVSCGMPAASA